MLFFQSHPIQYVSPLLRKLSQKTQLQVFYYGGKSNNHADKGFGQNVSWDIPLLDGYESTFLTNRSKATSMNTHFFDAINFGIFKVVRRSPSKIVILNGWAYCSDWFVLIAAFIFRKKIWLRAEMPWNQELKKTKTIKRKLKYYFFRWVVFRYFVDKFLFIGTQNKEFYLQHGVEENRLIFAPYSVENERFSNSSDLTSIKQRFVVSDESVVILYSGKLIDKKRPLDLLRAFHQLNNSCAKLIFLGDGPLRVDIEKYITNHNIQNVHITGFVNQSVIPNYYHLADIFVMCSGIGETWGLSVNEAMNAAVPVIVSDTCGCSSDLVTTDNGLVFREGDIDDLAEKLEILVGRKELRSKMGAQSQKIISGYSHEVTVLNLVKALS